MVVTVTTDASFNKAHEIGTYAFIVISNEFRYKKWGRLEGKVKTSQEAEFKAILNALYSVMHHKNTVHKKIIINTDCKTLITLIKSSNQTYKSKWGNDLLDFYKELLLKFPKNTVEVRHVKAHMTKGKMKPKNFVNDMCDSLCKQAMNKFLKDIKEPINTYTRVLPLLENKYALDVPPLPEERDEEGE